MDKQPDLFERSPLPPYAKGSETSRDSAVQAATFAADQRARVLAYVRRCGVSGATQKDAADALNISRQSAAPRFFELVEAKDIEKTTFRREGCAVYRAVAKAFVFDGKAFG